MRFADKVVIVTGAGRGIGAAYARGFAREGGVVIVADLKEDRARETAGRIEEQGGAAHPMVVDVSQKQQCEDLARQCVAEFGRIDVLVNNAGALFQEPFFESTEEHFDILFAVNVKGLFFCSQAVARHMVKQKSGKIVNISSIAATVGQANLSVYSASKGAVLSLTRAMALELAPHNVHVNVYLPGTTETPLAADALANPETRKQLSSNIPLGRLGDVEDHVGGVLFLASPEASWCTGTALVVDGGYSMV